MPVLAQRITFVGELGWELYCPAEYGRALWDLLWAAGARARDARRRLPGDRLAAAREGLPRLGRRHHARDDARRGRPRLRGARWTRPATSSAATRCSAEREADGPSERLRCLVLDDPRAVCLGDEPVRVDGDAAAAASPPAASATASSAASPTPTCRPTVEVGARVEVGVFGAWVGAEVANEPLYDPKMERVRA